MSRKIYRSRIHINLTLTGVNKDGKTIEIRFIRGNANVKCCYSTDKQEEQEFIEQDRLYKWNLLYIEKEIKTEEIKKEVEEEISTEETNKTMKQETYKNKQELYEKIKTMFPEEHIIARMTEQELLEVGKRNDVLFEKE